MLLWAHGMLGSPDGSKVQYLRGRGVALVAPDLRDQPLIERIARTRRALDAALADGHRVLLGGSSLGGLVVGAIAAELAATPGVLGAQVVGLVLAAPAFHICGAVEGAPAGLAAPEGLPVRIVHGRADAVVPVQASRDYRARSGRGVSLLEVDDDHRLDASLDHIYGAVRALQAPA